MQKFSLPSLKTLTSPKNRKVYIIVNIKNYMDPTRLKKILGMQTADTVAKKLHLSRQSAINILSHLQKEGHVTVKGGGRRVRLYTITLRKQRPRDPGMYDIINKYSPHFQITPWVDHQVHGTYGSEEAIIDAIQTKNFRVILASTRLFTHISDWKKLYRLAKKYNCWNQVGALYELSRLHFKVRHMPQRYHPITSKKKQLTRSGKENYPSIAKRWHTTIPFNNKDMEELKHANTH